MRTSYRFTQYAKAGMVFAATTVTYFFARATGVLPSWLNLNGEKSETTDMTVSEPSITQTMELMTRSVSADFSFSDLSVTDFEEVDLAPSTSQAELAIEQADTEEPYQVNTEPAPHPVRWHLLQQSSVIVANPIPDQVIEVNQQYVYPLDDVFAGDYSLITAVETGKISLSSWLSLQYGLIGSFSTDPFQAYGVVVSGSTLFVANYEVGLSILDVSTPSTPRLLGSYGTYVAGNNVQWQFVAVSGSTAFIANYNALFILDVSTLSAPQLLGSYGAARSRYFWYSSLRQYSIFGRNFWVADFECE